MTLSKNSLAHSLSKTMNTVQIPHWIQHDTVQFPKITKVQESTRQTQIALDTFFSSTTIHLLFCTTLYPRKYRQDMALDTLIDFVAEAVPTGIQISGRTLTLQNQVEDIGIRPSCDQYWWHPGKDVNDVFPAAGCMWLQTVDYLEEWWRMLRWTKSSPKPSYNHWMYELDSDWLRPLRLSWGFNQRLLIQAER